MSDAEQAMRIEWLDEALIDFDEAVSYLYERNPQAARQLATSIHLAVRGLLGNPEIGRPGRVPGTRELVVGSTRYIVPYRLGGRAIMILTVLHDAREWPAAFA